MLLLNTRFLTAVLHLQRAAIPFPFPLPLPLPLSLIA